MKVLIQLKKSQTNTPTDAKPSQATRKTIVKKGNEKVINIIESHLGHKVTDIVPFLSQPASSSSSAQPDTTHITYQEGEASSSTKPKPNITKQKPTIKENIQTKNRCRKNR